MKRFVKAGFAVVVLLTAGHTHNPAHAAERLELHVTPSVSLAPASVMVRAIVEHDADNRELEIVADSSDFYRRSVVELEGEQAPRTTELRLVDIPGGEYEVTATLYSVNGTKNTVRRSIMVMSQALK